MRHSRLKHDPGTNQAVDPDHALESPIAKVRSNVPVLLWARTWQKQGRIQFIRTAVRVNPADVVNADRGRSEPPGPMPRGICPTDRQDRSRGRFVRPRPA